MPIWTEAADGAPTAAAAPVTGDDRSERWDEVWGAGPDERPSDTVLPVAGPVTEVAEVWSDDRVADEWADEAMIDRRTEDTSHADELAGVWAGEAFAEQAGDGSAGRDPAAAVGAEKGPADAPAHGRRRRRRVVAATLGLVVAAVTGLAAWSSTVDRPWVPEILASPDDLDETATDAARQEPPPADTRAPAVEPEPEPEPSPPADAPVVRLRPTEPDPGALVPLPWDPFREAAAAPAPVPEPAAPLDAEPAEPATPAQPAPAPNPAGSSPAPADDASADGGQEGPAPTPDPEPDPAPEPTTPTVVIFDRTATGSCQADDGAEGAGYRLAWRTERASSVLLTLGAVETEVANEATRDVCIVAPVTATLTAVNEVGPTTVTIELVG